MAHGLFKSGRTAFALGDIKWRPKYGSSIKCLLTTRDYKPDLAKDSTLSDIPIKSRVGTDGNKTSEYFPKLHTMFPEDGCCGALDSVFNGVPTGKEIKHVVIFKDAPEEKDSLLIACVSVDFISNGTQIIIGWDTGPSKIFKL